MYRISISRTCDGVPAEVIFPVSGCDAAYATFRMARELCELAGGTVVLYDAETCEALADNREDDEPWED